MTRCYALAGIIVLAAAIAVSMAWYHRRPEPIASPPAAQPDRPESYTAAVDSLRARRLDLAARYTAAGDEDARQRILAEASTALTASLHNDLMPFWLGTPWDFNGTSQTPGTGKIACGYFVSTVLEHAGLRVQRVRLAQQASEKIILSLTGGTHVRRFSNVPLGRFVAAVRACGPGVYVVGLDSHAGFLVHDGSEVWFVHSSGVRPWCVVKERAAASGVLGGSRYRVIGRFTADDALIVKWLEQTPIGTRT